MEAHTVKSASETLLKSLNEVFWTIGDLIEAISNASPTLELKQRIERQRLEYDAALDILEIHILQTINALKYNESGQDLPVKDEKDGMELNVVDGVELSQSGIDQQLSVPIEPPPADGLEQDAEGADVLNPEDVGLFGDDFDFAT